MNQRYCLVFPEVPRYNVLVIVLKYSESKIISLRNIDSAIESEETIICVCPSQVTRVTEVFLSDGVRCQVSYDVSMKLFGVHDDTCLECW